MNEVAGTALPVAVPLSPNATNFTWHDLQKCPPVAGGATPDETSKTPERRLPVALSAATATAEGWPWQTWLILIGLGLLCVGVYAFHCWFRPFTNCNKCEGSGKHRSASGKTWRKCRRCKGSGTRIRTGRKVFNKLRVISEEVK